jgi:hypothetical protein
VPPITSNAKTSSIGSPRSPTQAPMNSGKASVSASASSAEPAEMVARWSAGNVIASCVPCVPSGLWLRLGVARSVSWRRRVRDRDIPFRSARVRRRSSAAQRSYRRHADGRRTHVRPEAASHSRVVSSTRSRARSAGSCGRPRRLSHHAPRRRAGPP